MRRINIYIIEDSLIPFNRMKATLESIKYDLGQVRSSKYGGIRIIGINPSDSKLGSITSQGECELYLESKFQKRPPHVIILDWELKWGYDEENTNFFYSFDGDRVIEYIDRNTHFTPYIIFSSTRKDKSFPDIVEGIGLERLYPHTINLIKKSSLTLQDEEQKGYEYNVAIESVRMGVDYALSKEIPLTVFDFPTFEQYQYEEVNGAWVEQNPNIFAIRGNEKSVRDILVRQHEIVSIIVGGEKFAIVLWKDNSLKLLMCHFKRKKGSHNSKSSVHARFPFLTRADFLLYNEMYFESLAKGYYRFNVQDKTAFVAFRDMLKDHVIKTDDHLLEMDIEGKKNEEINPFYHAFCAFDEVEPWNDD